MKTMTSVACSDEELVMDLLSGNKNAFGFLYSKYFPMVYARCYSFFRDRDTARDQAQDIMIRVIEKLPSFHFQSKFSTWLYRLTVNYCIDEQRKFKIRKKRAERIEIEIEESEPHVPQYAVLEKIRSLLELPSTTDDELLSLKYLHGRSIEELTVIYQASPSAIKMRLSRARTRIANTLKHELTPN